MRGIEGNEAAERRQRDMTIEPIAYFHSPLTTKFGIPRQSGLAESLPGHIVFEPAYRQAEAVRGLEAFDYLWLIWEFSANRSGNDGQAADHPAPPRLTVRPPRLGGNERVGVFASRSPFRPNRLGTPIFDMKPYVAYADSHPEARSGFVDDHEWKPLQVVIPPEIASKFTPDEVEALRQVLAQDPRPRYHDDEERVYGMLYCGHDIHFRIRQNRVVLEKS